MIRRSGLLGMYALAGACGGGGGKPSVTDCAAYVDHASRLEQEGSDDYMPMFKFSRSERTFFLERCPEVLSAKTIECALKAGRLEDLDRCEPRRAISHRVEGESKKKQQDKGAAEWPEGKGKDEGEQTAPAAPGAERIERGFAPGPETARRLEEQRRMEREVLQGRLPRPQEQGASEAEQQMERMVDDLCACRDQACLRIRSAKWSEVARRSQVTGPTTTTLRMKAQSDRLAACHAELFRNTESPVTAPAEPAAQPPTEDEQ